MSLDALRSREPSTELEGDTFQSVSKQAGRRRQGGQVDDEQHFAALCEYLRQGKLPVQRFRMLTDYPEKAAFLKAEVRKALQPVIMPSVQQVQTGPVPTTTAPVQQPQPRMNAATRPVIDTGSSSPRHERMAASTARPDTTRQPAQAEQPRLGQSTATPTIAQDPPKNLWAGVVTGAVKPSATMAMPTTGGQPGARQPVITNNGPGRGTADRGGSGTGTQGGGYNRGATGASGTGRPNQKYKGKKTYYSKK